MEAAQPGAQTERRGAARPVRVLLGGETSPAAFLCFLSLSAGNRLFMAAAPAEYYRGRFSFSLGADIMAYKAPGSAALRRRTKGSLRRGRCRS